MLVAVRVQEGSRTDRGYAPPPRPPVGSRPNTAVEVNHVTDTVERFAVGLQNGVVLCDLLNVLHSGATANIIRGVNLRPFQVRNATKGWREKERAG